jgi:N-methylhydantoinase B
MNPIELSLFTSRMSAVCEEMGAQLRRAAFSPNIRDRLDFSCAVFDPHGELCAQAAHIPVHLGSMAYAMREIVACIEWQPGDMIALNDPFLGGTHLPDVTVIAPVYSGGRLAGFVANRAHHADIGASSPGSMPISRSLDEEGQIIPPQHIMRNDDADVALLANITRNTRNPRDAEGDFAAQISANRRGLMRLRTLIDGLSVDRYLAALTELNDYAERLARASLNDIQAGRYEFTDVMDDDGLGQRDIAIRVAITATADGIDVDFAGTAAQVPGNINCPLPVTAAAVFYAFRCLMPADTPACAGSFRPLRLSAPPGCLVNAQRPAAVAAGNVETSTRIVDVVLGALAKALPARIPAASHGSMNNLAMGESGAQSWGYYETLGGGMGAGPRGPGLSAIQTHMTNTRNTPIEVLETRYPVRVRRYCIRRGSGGAGRHRGGDGLIREYEFLRPVQFTLLTERRLHRPWGLAGGGAGQAGVNQLNGEVLPGKVQREARPGDRLIIETAGGGGWGEPDQRRTALMAGVYQNQ